MSNATKVWGAILSAVVTLLIFVAGVVYGGQRIEIESQHKMAAYVLKADFEAYKASTDRQYFELQRQLSQLNEKVAVLIDRKENP